MKKNNLFFFIFVVTVITSCTGNEDLHFEQELVHGYTKNNVANTRAIEDISPLIPKEMTFENSDTLVSENSNYRALNISFSSQETIIGYQNVEGNYVNPVEVWHNVVEVTKKSTNNSTKFLVSLIPDFLYYKNHKFLEWNNFKHLAKRSDFSGYEIRSDWETGQILSVYYYYNGNCLYHVKATDEVKYDFMKSIIEQFGFQKVSLINSNEYIVHKFIEDMLRGIYGYLKDIIKIRLAWITLLDGVDDLDHGDLPPENNGETGGGSNGGSSGGHNYNTNYSITGNETLFTSEIITHFAEHSFESSPCTIVSLALQYYNRNKSPLDILNEAKANNNGQSLYIYKNGFRTEDLKKVIGTNFTYKKSENVKNVINNKRPLFSVYHPTGSSNYVSAVLIVGYYGENLIIYDPESDSLKSLNPGIFDMDDTFELVSVL